MGSWVAYWSRDGFDHRFWRRSMDWYNDNLRAAGWFSSTDRIIDYGAGPGYVAAGLAPQIAHLYLAEPSCALLKQAYENCQSLENVSVVDTSNQNWQDKFNDEPLDWVLMNSVVQYIPKQALSTLLRDFHRLLKPGGSLVLSDLIPEGRSVFADVASVSRYYWQWFGVRAWLAYLISEVRHLPARRGMSLTHIHPDWLEQELSGDFKLEWRNNPTVCEGRLCVRCIKV